MKPFDVKEALAGKPCVSKSGKIIYIFKDVREFGFDIDLPLMGIIIFNQNNFTITRWDDNGDNNLSSDYCIAGMYDEPELTSEQVLEKAYEDDLLVLCDGNPDLPLKVIAKAKNGEFVMQPEDDTIQPWLANLTMEWFFVKDPAPKSNTITVTLPKPFKPKEGEVYYSIGGYHNGMIDEMHANCMTHISILSGNCFRAESDAKAWLDAMKSSLDD